MNDTITVNKRDYEDLVATKAQLEEAIEILTESIGPSGDEVVHNALLEAGYYEEVADE